MLYAHRLRIEVVPPLRPAAARVQQEPPNTDGILVRRKRFFNSVGRTACASENRLARPVLRAILSLDAPPKRSISLGDLFRGLGLGEGWEGDALRRGHRRLMRVSSDRFGRTVG